MAVRKRIQSNQSQEARATPNQAFRLDAKADARAYSVGAQREGEQYRVRVVPEPGLQLSDRLELRLRVEGDQRMLLERVALEGGAIEILVPVEWLPSGTHRLELWREGASEPAASYRLAIP